jgi:hypothetical protein
MQGACRSEDWRKERPTPQTGYPKHRSLPVAKSTGRFSLIEMHRLVA